MNNAPLVKLPPNPAATPERETLIALIARKRNSTVIIATLADVEEEVRLTAPARDDDSIIDVEAVTIPSAELVSQLADSEAVVEAREASRHDVDVMSRAEWAQARRDVQAYRAEREARIEREWRAAHPVLSWIVPASFFARSAVRA